MSLHHLQPIQSPYRPFKPSNLHCSSLSFSHIDCTDREIEGLRVMRRYLSLRNIALSHARASRSHSPFDTSLLLLKLLLLLWRCCCCDAAATDFGARRSYHVFAYLVPLGYLAYTRSKLFPLPRIRTQYELELNKRWNINTNDYTVLTFKSMLVWFMWDRCRVFAFVCKYAYQKQQQQVLCGGRRKRRLLKRKQKNRS